MSINLKPCPFCGHKPKIYKSNIYSDRNPKGKPYWNVCCTYQYCPIYMCDTNPYFKRYKAIEAWNKRENNINKEESK